MCYLLCEVFFAIDHFWLICSWLIPGIFCQVFKGRLGHLKVVHQYIVSRH